jgi:hypothetical protein
VAHPDRVVAANKIKANGRILNKFDLLNPDGGGCTAAFQASFNASPCFGIGDNS